MHEKHVVPCLLRVKVKVTQSCPTLCDPMDYTVHGILQSMEWLPIAFSRVSSQPRDWTQISLTLQADSLPAGPPGKPNNTGMGSLSLLQGLPDPGIEPGSPSLQEDSLPAELPRKPREREREIYYLQLVCWTVWTSEEHTGSGLIFLQPWDSFKWILSHLPSLLLDNISASQLPSACPAVCLFFLWLCWVFIAVPSCVKWGLLCSARASHCGGFSCEKALGHMGLSSCSRKAQ